jgi:hypothetical protein
VPRLGPRKQALEQRKRPENPGQITPAGRIPHRRGLFRTPAPTSLLIYRWQELQLSPGLKCFRDSEWQAVQFMEAVCHDGFGGDVG